MKGFQLISGAVVGVILTVVVYSAATRLCVIPSGRSHLVMIGPRAKDIPSDEAVAHISKSKGHQITWRSTNKQTLLIEFEVAKLPGGQDPFVNMTLSEDKKYKRVYCSGDECKSDAINPNLQYSGLFSCLEFKYDQQIGNDREDAGIIIEK